MRYFSLTPVRLLLLRLIAPDSVTHLANCQNQIAELQHATEWLDDSLNKAVRDLQSLRKTVCEVADERDHCLDNLMALVAIDDDGHWTTVFDADTRLPDQIGSYLGALVERA